VDSFLSAVHRFTGLKIRRGAVPPIDPAALMWSPVVGLLATILTISFYIPLAAFYLPSEVAVIPAFVAICLVRGFKPEIDFCQLCDSFPGRKKGLSRRSTAGVPSVTCLIFAALLKYAIARQFFLLESVKLLGFGTFVTFVVPLLRPKSPGWIIFLGGSWLLVSAIAAFSPLKTNGFTALLLSLRGPVVASALIYLFVRLTFQLADEPAPVNVAALPAELAAYLSFMLARYHFL
jgi:hypothetical protein